MIKSVVFVFCVLSFNFVFGQASEIKLIQHINSLSMDSMEVRSAGSRGEKNANKYIRENWGQGKRTTYYSWEYNLKKDADSVTSEMVGSFLYNKAKATILIAAPLENAADVALFLGLQSELAQLKLDVNIMLVAVTSYNNGHQGLDYLATHMPKKARDIRLVINLNDIGNMDKAKPELSINATSGIFQELQTMIKQFELVEQDMVLLNELGTKNYYNRGIQCLSISTVKGSDEISVNTHGVAQIQEFLVQWIKTK